MANDAEGLRPVCFMVMPFNRKRVDLPERAAAPAEVDFNALWDKALRPAIEDLGYLAVRADQDPGSLIVKDMFERLALADLVLADVSLPNGNVYYEVGMRHVARETDCVLVAADWSDQLFDIEQFRMVRYPLADGSVPDAAAQAIRERLSADVARLKDSRTPYYELISNAGDSARRRGVFREHAERMSAFQAKLREVRLLRDKAERIERVRELSDGVDRAALQIPEVAIELMTLIRDELDWADARGFIENALPDAVRELPRVKEQHLLAIAETGNPEEAIAKLEELIRTQGDSTERRGLIGGRYKRLWQAARREREGRGETRASPVERRYLNQAIDNYAAGMRLDLNEYYCAANLPFLLRTRGRPGDADRARFIDRLVIEACERAIELGAGDEWVRPTLLGTAFRAGDVEKAQELADQIETEGHARWMLTSTLNDLRNAAEAHDEADLRDALGAIVDQLAALVEG